MQHVKNRVSVSLGSDQKRHRTIWHQESSGVRTCTSQPKINHLAEFFWVIWGVDGHEHVQISGSR